MLTCVFGACFSSGWIWKLLVGVTVFGKIRTASEVGAAEKAQHFEPELFGQKWQWVPHNHVAIV